MLKVRLVHEQIADSLLQKIRSNEWKGGDPVYSEAEAMRIFDVSRGTVRKAYASLIGNGYLKTVRGKGTFVAETALEMLAREGRDRLQNCKIALIIPASEGFYEPVVRGVSENVEKNGWKLLVMHNGSPKEELQCIRNILRHTDIDGVIIMSGRVKDEHRADFYTAVFHRNIPIVSISRPPHGILASAVYVDDSVTVYSMVEKLYSKDCKTCVVFYESSEGDVTFSNRLRAYIIAMARYYPSRPPFCIDVDRAEWDEKLEEFLKETKEKIGLLVFRGDTVQPVLSVIERAGKRVGKDVALIAYGPDQTYEFIDKKLSIMEIPRYELGKKSVEMLYELLAGEDVTSVKHLIFKAKYLEGETS